MRHEFDHYGGRQLFLRLKELFNSGGAFQITNLQFVFVCGGKLDPASGSMRSAFLNWVTIQFPSLVPIRAEAAFEKTQLLEPSEFPNLGRFEKLIAAVADCVIIFPESEGSYAELGLFSAIADIRKKILVVNKLKYQASNSFLQLGPIDEINIASRFRPALHFNPDTPPIDFEPVKTTLIERLKFRERRKRLAPLTYRDLDMQQKLVLSHEFIRLFRTISLEALLDSFRQVFGNVFPAQIRKVVSLLLAMESIEYKEDTLSIRHQPSSYLEYDGEDPNEFIAYTAVVRAKQDDVMFT
jgi:hypothetical protein